MYGQRYLFRSPHFIWINLIMRRRWNDGKEFDSGNHLQMAETFSYFHLGVALLQPILTLANDSLGGAIGGTQ